MASNQFRLDFGKFMKKVLYIHAGGQKTGSSNIQNILNENFHILERHGYAYENRLVLKSQYDITSGNGDYLYSALACEKESDHFIDGMVLSYFGIKNNAICSCEHFSSLSPKNWERLLQSASRIGVELKVIFYVRNVLSFFNSAYDQTIKRSGEWRTFDEWVTSSEWSHFDSLESIGQVIPNDQILVFHYDKEQENLMASFMTAINLDIDNKDIKSLVEKSISIKINRSLTNLEREILRDVNINMPSMYGLELSDAFLSNYPNTTPEPNHLSEDLEILLRKKFQRKVSKINNQYFNGKPIVSESVATHQIQAFSKNSSSNSFSSGMTIERFALKWSLETMKNINEETERRILSKLTRSIFSSKTEKFNTEIPVDFDALSYLYLNPDVAVSGLSAHTHYLSFGKNEGRPYKYSSTEMSESERRNLLNKINDLTRLIHQWSIHANKCAKNSLERERLLASRLRAYTISNKKNLMSHLKIDFYQFITRFKWFNYHD